MTAWLESVIAFDAVIANDDAMALGAADAMNDAGIDPGSVVVAGIGATRDGLSAVREGRIDVTIFMETPTQGARAIDTALSLSQSRVQRPRVYVPSQLVTKDTVERVPQQNSAPHGAIVAVSLSGIVRFMVPWKLGSRLGC